MFSSWIFLCSSSSWWRSCCSYSCSHFRATPETCRGLYCELPHCAAGHTLKTHIELRAQDPTWILNHKTQSDRHWFLL
ncbi:hypothetical protein OYC64_015359 [Pagothenia borchgrevinki]|uniref:Secreted protein n=1 Tax=Pagothenia borchgrevinki TaxID=8213 RepID=A0ABD2HGL9_PAGBO